jgi:hypothetical protein
MLAFEINDELSDDELERKIANFEISLKLYIEQYAEFLEVTKLHLK